MHITVILSVLNGEAYLGKAVNSILNQTHADFKFITINNGSSDSSGKILDKYAIKDNRIQVVHNTKTVTLVEARMQGMQIAQTDWVAWMDADDISEPQRLKKQLDLIEIYGNKLCALGTWGHYISEDERILGEVKMQPTTPEAFTAMYSKNEAIVILDPSAVIHKPTFLAVGGYRPECTPAGDLDLWYRMTEAGRIILVVPEFLIQYRVHSGSDSVSKTMLQRKKTHFINYNMRQRRSAKNELSWEDFLAQVWSDTLYRLPRWRNDLGLSYFKHAGLHYGDRHYGKFLLNLMAAAVIKPIYVIKRVTLQQGNRLKRILKTPTATGS